MGGAIGVADAATGGAWWEGRGKVLKAATPPLSPLSPSPFVPRLLRGRLSSADVEAAPPDPAVALTLAAAAADVAS